MGFMELTLLPVTLVLVYLALHSALVLCSPGPLVRRCVRLVEFARSQGGRDDATVLVVRRVERPRKGLGRLLAGAALFALVAAALAALVGDNVAAPSFTPQMNRPTVQEPP